jgi:GR25 family glycosyltransferase involved in LPS biosynthesis
VDADFVLSHAVEGKRRPVEKACLLSHKKAIELSLERNSNALILEDDAQFGPNSFNFLKILDTVQDDSIDIIFTDIGIPEVHTMIDLFCLRRNLIRDSTFDLIDLKNFSFAGTTGYLILNHAKRKILNLIETLRSYDTPYDLQLRQWIDNEKLKAKFVFPFATTVSRLSNSSTIQPEFGINQVIGTSANAFRRLMWEDSDRVPDNPIDGLQEIEAAFIDTRTLMFSRILSVFLFPGISDS